MNGWGVMGGMGEDGKIGVGVRMDIDRSFCGSNPLRVFFISHKKANTHLLYVSFLLTLSLLFYISLC